MIPFEKCPVCSGDMVEKAVEKLLRGGNNTASVKTKAEVCLKCGERLYSKETVSRFEEIRQKLDRAGAGKVEGLKPMGHSYEAVA